MQRLEEAYLNLALRRTVLRCSTDSKRLLFDFPTGRHVFQSWVHHCHRTCWKMGTWKGMRRFRGFQWTYVSWKLRWQTVSWKLRWQTVSKQVCFSLLHRFFHIFLHIAVLCCDIHHNRYFQTIPGVKSSPCIFSVISKGYEGKLLKRSRNPVAHYTNWFANFPCERECILLQEKAWSIRQVELQRLAWIADFPPRLLTMLFILSILEIPTTCLICQKFGTDPFCKSSRVASWSVWTPHRI